MSNTFGHWWSPQYCNFHETWNSCFMYIWSKQFNDLNKQILSKSSSNTVLVDITSKKLSNYVKVFNKDTEFFRDFQTYSSWAFSVLLPKTCRTYPTMKKPDTVIPYLKKIQKYINHVTHPLSSADISIFWTEISNFCYIKKLSTLHEKLRFVCK